MYSTNSPPAPVNFTPPSSKAVSQKMYREKEGECINTLRIIVKQLAGEELQTRYEILTKVIDILSAITETKRQEEVRMDTLAQYQMTATDASNPADLVSAHSDYSPQVHFQHWQNAESAFYMQTGQPSGSGQQYYMSNSYGDPTFEQSDYHEPGKNWSHGQF